MDVLRMNRLCNLVPFDCLRHYCMSLLEQLSPAGRLDFRSLVVQLVYWNSRGRRPA